MYLRAIPLYSLEPSGYIDVPNTWRHEESEPFRPYAQSALSPSIVFGGLPPYTPGRDRDAMPSQYEDSLMMKSPRP